MGDEDKQFEATPQKLEKARKEGQVVKSKDVSMAVSLLVMFWLLEKLAPFIWSEISQLFILLYEQIPNRSLDEIGLPYITFLTIKTTAVILTPILFVAVLMGIFGDLMQVGPLFTTTPLEPKLDKLNPTKYFKNLFSMKTVFELFKNIAKVTIFGLVVFFFYNEHFAAIFGLAAVYSKFAVMFEFGKLVSDFVIKAGMMFLVIAGADYMVTRMKFLKDQKMSFKEIKDEYKSSEGDLKAALRQRPQQMMQQRMMDSIPAADFVVTNPLHVAVALKYVTEEMNAPKLVAKGTELFAKKIIDIAKKNNVPVIENPPVARAIFKLVDVNKEVPPELYKAIAEILLFVYNLRKNKKVVKID